MNKPEIKAIILRIASHECPLFERPRLREQIQNMVDTGDKWATETLAELMNDSDVTVASESIGIVIRSKQSNNYIHAILDKLAHSPFEIQGSICYDLAMLPTFGPITVEPLAKLLKECVSADARYWAVLALEGTMNSLAIPALEWTKIHDKGETFEGRSIAAAAEWAIELIQKRCNGSDESSN